MDISDGMAFDHNEAQSLSVVEPRVNNSKDEKKLFFQLQAQSPCTEGQESQILHTITFSALALLFL